MSADEVGGTASMSATNGELNPSTPDPPALATPGKRKRVSSHDDKGSHDTNPVASQAQEKIKLQENLRNLTEILARHDTELQLLSCPLPSSPAKPRSKRAKVSGDRDEIVSIQTRVVSARYNSVSEFLTDIERASATVIERSKTLATGNQPDGSSPLTETVNRIAAFKKVLNTLVRHTQVNQSNVKAETSEDDTEPPRSSTPPAAETRNESLVLTLFGNPANPKQLYSSLQKSVKVPLPSDDPATEKYVEVQAPLPEVGLPNGITTTKAVHHDLEDKSKDLPKRTFGDVFAPRQTLPQLEPPRRARSSSRGVNGWIDNFEAITNYKAFLGDRNNYCLAPLPSGQWLQYGGVTSSPTYWNRRQKQQSSQQLGQDRFDEDSAMWTDDDASLLQGVYSSFAPSFDSSGAVLQEDSKDSVWWSRRGARRLYTLLSAPYQEKETVSACPGNIGDLDEDTLEEMVKSYNPEEFADGVVHNEVPKEDTEEDTSGEKDLDDMLRDISDLLETLSSSQKNRNLEASPPSGSQGIDPKESDPDSGSSLTPATAEQSVYETLRSGLAALVSSLPPYAVAKLNGGQLDELNISQKVVFENPDYRGTMEKDDVTIQQERAAAMAPVAGGANRTPSRSGNYPVTGFNQRPYAHSPQAQQQQQQQPPQASFQAPPFYGGRQPSTSGPFTPGPQHYAGARPPTTPSQRPAFIPGYNPPTPQYNQGSHMRQFPRPGQNGFNPYAGQQGPASAQASPQQYTPRPGQPGYNPAFGAGRSASPQKPPSYAAPRTPYMTPGSANPQQRYLSQQQQQPAYGNYPSNQAPTPSGAYSNSAAATIYARSAAEQAVLMERNKQQLRQSSTPQPATEHSDSQDRSATPSSKPNGTPMGA
ncbi:hypothetical protein FE257_005017 [Aspergillus nanangensis]|uniref:Uncharacterized protein n=1 Tax=Aspergillus nanangensis TaxID=2582783 RepID=A0AAD4CRG0_ASPNN|nr:hypothetical protein FE257_005017 [Aspergillus nanangensis]